MPYQVEDFVVNERANDSVESVLRRVRWLRGHVTQSNSAKQTVRQLLATGNTPSPLLSPIEWTPVAANLSGCEEASDVQISDSTTGLLQSCVAADRSSLCAYEHIAAACPLHCGRAPCVKPPAWGILWMIYLDMWLAANALCVAATCIDVSQKVVAKFVERNYGYPGYTCGIAKEHGMCSTATAKRMCPMTCSACEKPADNSAFAMSTRFCISNRPYCDPTSECGSTIESQQECAEAMLGGQLAIQHNLSIVSLKSKGTNANDLPRGCLLDEILRPFFNAEGSDLNNIAGLLSVCRVNAKNGEPNSHCREGDGMCACVCRDIPAKVEQGEHQCLWARRANHDLQCCCCGP